MNLNMQSVSRTAEAIEWASVPRENPQKRSFGRRAWACVLLMLIGLVFFTTADAAATYYVSSSSGSDANPGTQSAPWRTLAKVYKSKSLFKPGDNILLKRGDTWYEIFNIAHQAGVSGTPIIYGAYGSGVLPTVDAQNARLFGVYMDNVSHIIVRDLRTINATADGFRIVAAMGNVSDIVVQGVVSEKNTRDGFSVEATLGVTHVDALEYHDDVAHLNGRSGFHAFHVSDGATGIHYYGCKATYNGQLGANHGFSGYFANNLHYHEVEAAFTNINPATGLPNSFTGEGIGISFDDYTSNSSVEHSYIHDNARTGVVLAHRGSNNTASYNVIAFNGVYGLVVNGKTGSNNIQILNNTIYGNKGYGIQAWLPINGLAIKNNVLVNNAGYGIGFSATGITNSTVAANLFFGNTLGTMSYVPGATGTIVADPAFTAPASRDFSLQASSPAINKGLYLGGPYQLGLKKGSIWPFNVLLQDQGLSSWDIGSFVYTSGGLTSSTTLLASSANPSLLGAIVTFTATVTGTAPTGSVAFRANGTTLSGCGAIALPAGTANSKTVTCSTAGLSAGVHSIVASYAGNATNNGSTSAPLSQVVNINSKTASTTGLASSANPSLLGASVTFTATVTGRAPTGSVAFKANGTTFSGCGAIALPAGTANSKTVICSTAGLSAATHSIVATYAGDAGNNGSSSAALSQVVNALVNPSFEIPVLPSGSYQSNPSATGIGWTFSGNSGIQRNGSGWGAALAPAGTQTAFINMTGTIRQTLNLTAGSYTLSFQAARRSCCVSPYVQPVKVTMDGTQIGSLVSPTSTSFTAFSIPFSVATSGTHTLTFTGTDPANKTTFIDAVMLRRNSP